jgi:hypothetical protein
MYSLVHRDVNYYYLELMIKTKLWFDKRTYPKIIYKKKKKSVGSSIFSQVKML